MKNVKKLNLHNYETYEDTVIAYNQYIEICSLLSQPVSLPLSFADWCNLPTEYTDGQRTLVNFISWIKPGQWFFLKNIQLFGSDIDFVRVQRVSINGIQFTNEYLLSVEDYHKVMTSKLQHQRFVPVTIEPWSLEDVRLAMKRNVGIHICVDKQAGGYLELYHTISDIRLSRDAQYPQVSLTNGRSYYTDILAKIAETEHYEPCGTGVIKAQTNQQ